MENLNTKSKKKQKVEFYDKKRIQLCNIRIILKLLLQN
jgi:hypothetical protein